MRLLLLSCIFLWAFQGICQSPATTLLSAVVVGPDSLPVPDVAIVNVRTGHTVRTNESGFFQTHIAEVDSVFIYHIAFKRQFANEKANGKIIVLEPQVNELDQVDVNNDAMQEMKNLQKTLEEIKGAASKKKFSDADFSESSRQKNFVERNGSHTKGFMPFFGPTIPVPLERIIELVGGNVDKRQRKKLTSHYHLVKMKNDENEK